MNPCLKTDEKARCNDESSLEETTTLLVGEKTLVMRKLLDHIITNGQLGECALA
jgi:hypothetical protein